MLRLLLWFDPVSSLAEGLLSADGCHLMDLNPWLREAYGILVSWCVCVLSYALCLGTKYAVGPTWTCTCPNPSLLLSALWWCFSGFQCWGWSAAVIGSLDIILLSHRQCTDVIQQWHIDIPQITCLCHGDDMLPSESWSKDNRLCWCFHGQLRCYWEGLRQCCFAWAFGPCWAGVGAPAPTSSELLPGLA